MKEAENNVWITLMTFLALKANSLTKRLACVLKKLGVKSCAHTDNKSILESSALVFHNLNTIPCIAVNLLYLYLTRLKILNVMKQEESSAWTTQTKYLVRAKDNTLTKRPVCACQ